MKKSPIALAFFALLFAGWMVYLGTQALRKANPIVISRAQLAVSRYEVEVDLQEIPRNKEQVKLTVRNVLYAAENPKPGTQIVVTNLDQTQGFAGSGAYLLPLVKEGDQYQVAGYPLDPGFPAFQPLPKPRIYPFTADVKHQHEQIRAH
jgi:hypothetical protein